MPDVVSEAFRNRLARTRVLPVVTLDDPSQGVPVAQSLMRGGIDLMEVTFRTTAAVRAIASIGSEVPEVLVGAGTVTRPDEARQATDAGASFVVSPGRNAAVTEAVGSAGPVVLPGVATPTEIEAALEAGHQLVKLFPAHFLGGVGAAETLLDTYRHRGLELLPTGGVGIDDAVEYLAVCGVIAVGGGWLTPRELVRDGAWDEIAALAKTASALALRS